MNYASDQSLANCAVSSVSTSESTQARISAEEPMSMYKFYAIIRIMVFISIRPMSLVCSMIGGTKHAHVSRSQAGGHESLTGLVGVVHD